MSESRFIRAWCLFLGLLTASLTAHPIAETDPFWHLNLARAVLAHGSRLVPEPSAVAAFSDAAFVPEWLWSLLTYGLFQLGGGPAMTLLVMAVGMAIPFAMLALLRAAAPRAPLPGLLLVSGLLVVMVLARLRVRPQALFMLLLPVFLWLSMRFVAAPRDGRRAVALLGAALVWVQVHGSFVLMPAIFALLCAEPFFTRCDTAMRRRMLAVGVGLLAAGTTSAYGLEVYSYILAHGGGDAKLHIQDLAPPTWEIFRPGGSPFATAYLLLWAIALLGAMRRRTTPAFWCLALLGLALGLNGRRFFAAGGILLGPLALEGATALLSGWRASHRRRLAPAAALTVCAVLFVWTASVIELRRGPLGRLDFADRHPRAAAAHLASLPVGTPVLTSFGASAAVSFWTDGRVRTFVDTRIPLRFDDTDHALARDIFLGDPRAFEHAVAFHGFEAVVVDRHEPLCRHVDAASDWQPVVIEPAYSTFVREAERPLARVAACGGAYLRPDPCEAGGLALAEDVRQLEALDPSPFARFLRASHAFYCGQSIEAAERLLPAERDARAFATNRRHLEARILLLQRRTGAAVALLRADVEAGDSSALQLLMPPIAAGAIPAAQAHRLLETFVHGQDDGTAPAVRAELARLCAELGDEECVRFHGLRALALGSREALPAAAWLVERHSSERVRRDAARWQALTQRRTSSTAKR